MNLQMRKSSSHAGLSVALGDPFTVNRGVDEALVSRIANKLL